MVDRDRATAAGLAAQTIETRKDWQDALDCLDPRLDLLPQVEAVYLSFHRMGLDLSPLSAAHLVLILASSQEAGRG